MDQANDFLQKSENLKILDDESPIVQEPIPYEDAGEPDSVSDPVIDTTPDEPEYYEQLLKESPAFPEPRMDNGGSYVPLNREKSYSPSAWPQPKSSDPYGKPVVNRSFAPNGAYAPQGSYGTGGSYIPDRATGTNGMYAPNGSYAPGIGNASKGYSAPNGVNSPYGTAMLPMPTVKKNRKPIVSLIFGIGAMGVLNYFPFIALILGLIALCTGYIGLKKGELATGKRVCGFIGLALGIISLILSVSMLVMLLSLSVKVSKMGLYAQGFLNW